MTESKLLAVFGATGQQGGSVINYILNDPILFRKYKLRAITRNPSQPAARALALKGVEVIQGDANNLESLKVALANCHTIFSVTTPVMGTLILSF
jgi:uncharacterized protein YbjT (DUF2867 family)